MRNLKKVLAIALAFALVLSLGMSALAAKWTDETFKDWADVGADYKADVQRLAVHDQGLNVFQGDTGNNFNPQKTFTRAELVAIVALIDKGGYATGKTLNEMFATDAQRGEKFSDVSKDDWYFAVVNYAAFNGYTEGDGTGKFNPDGIVTSDMLYSYVLSLLGFQKEDMNGADWVGKVNSIIRLYGFDFNKAVNYNVTREEVAKVLSKAVDTAKYFRDNANNTYKKDGDKKLLDNFDGSSKKEAGSIEIEGKVIKTKYAHLEGADIYPDNNVVLWVPGDNKNGGSGTIWQIDDPSDDFVPTKYLGRYVKVDVVRTGTSGGSHYRQAVGSKATPSYNNDVAALDYNTTTNTFKNAFTSATEKAVTGNSWYNWTAGRAQPTRGAYLNFSGSRINLATTGGDATDYRNWQVNNTIADVGNVWDYAYAIRDINIGAYTEVFYMNYIALRVGDTLRNGKTKFNFLDSDDCNYAEQKLGDIEFGDTAKKGDIVIGIVKAQDDGSNGLMTLEVIASADGMRHLGTNSADIDGARYERSNVWGGVTSADFNRLDKNKTYGYFVVNPVYAVAFDVDTYGVYGTFWATQFDKSIEVNELNYHVHANLGVVLNSNGSVSLTGVTAAADYSTSYYYISTINDIDRLKKLVGNTKTELESLMNLGTIGTPGVTYENGVAVGNALVTAGDWARIGNVANLNTNANNGRYIVAFTADANGIVLDVAVSDKINRAATVYTASDILDGITFAVSGAGVLELDLAGVAGAAFDTTAADLVEGYTATNAKATILAANVFKSGSLTYKMTYANGYTGPATVSVPFTYITGTSSTGADTSISATVIPGHITTAPITGKILWNKGTPGSATPTAWAAGTNTVNITATAASGTYLAIFEQNGITYVLAISHTGA